MVVEKLLIKKLNNSSDFITVSITNKYRINK